VDLVRLRRPVDALRGRARSPQQVGGRQRRQTRRLPGAEERDEHRRPAGVAPVNYAARIERARARMDDVGVDMLLLSVAAVLPYFPGYEAIPLDRLTMFILPKAGDANLVVPRLEAPRVHAQPDVFEIVPWDETDAPVALVARIANRPAVAAIGDQTWAR